MHFWLRYSFSQAVTLLCWDCFIPPEVGVSKTVLLAGSHGFIIIFFDTPRLCFWAARGVRRKIFSAVWWKMRLKRAVIKMRWDCFSLKYVMILSVLTWMRIKSWFIWRIFSTVGWRSAAPNAANVRFGQIVLSVTCILCWEQPSCIRGHAEVTVTQSQTHQRFFFLCCPCSCEAKHTGNEHAAGTESHIIKPPDKQERVVIAVAVAPFMWKCSDRDYFGMLWECGFQ